MSRSVKANGAKIKQLRQLKGMEQDELARQAKCSIRSLQHAESSHNVYLITINGIASALGVTSAVL